MEKFKKIALMKESLTATIGEAAEAVQVNVDGQGNKHI